jgi:hypothetical protein
LSGPRPRPHQQQCVTRQGKPSLRTQRLGDEPGLVVAALPLPMPRNRQRHVCGQRRPPLNHRLSKPLSQRPVMNPVTWRPLEGMRLLLARMATKRLLSTVLHANVRPQISHSSGGVAHELRYSPQIGTRLALVNSWSQILHRQGKAHSSRRRLLLRTICQHPSAIPSGCSNERSLLPSGKEKSSAPGLNNERENVR